MKVVLVIVIGVVLFCGCSTMRTEGMRNLSQSETQAKQNAEAVNLAAIQAGQLQKLLSTATNNVDKGLRIQANGKDVVRLPDGSPYEVSRDGALLPILADWSYEASLNSYVDLASGNIEDLQLHVGKIVVVPDGNIGMSTIPKRDGLSLSISKSSGSSTNAEAIRALKDGHAKEKEAAGDAVAKVIEIDWEGKRGTYVEVIKATGEAVTGILMSLTPIGQGTDALKAVIRTVDGGVEEVAIPAEGE